MKDKIRRIIGVPFFFLLGGVLFFPALGSGADLKYIRIGEHKDYTRIVFEFQGAVSFKKPVPEGKGRLSVVFVDSKTTLPQKIVSETAKWVNTISFTHSKSDLIATLSFAFPYFDVKAFSLTNPQRVVLDVSEKQVIKKEDIKEEALEKKDLAAAKAVKKSPEKLTGTPELLPEEKKRVKPPVTPAPAEPLPEPEKNAELTPKAPPVINLSPKVIPTPEKTSETVSPQKPARTPASPLPPVEKPPVETMGKQGDDQGGGWFPIEENRLEIYLLSALVFLSAIIVGLLLLTNVRKRRRRRTGQSSEILHDGLDTSVDDIDGIAFDRLVSDELEEDGDIDQRIAAVDNKIRDALNKIKKS